MRAVPPVLLGLSGNIIGEKIEEVEVCQVAVDPVADENIITAVVICVEEKGAPPPVGAVYVGVIGELGKTSGAVVYLQGIAHILVVEPAFSLLL